MKEKVTDRILAISKANQPDTEDLATEMILKLQDFSEGDCYWSIRDIAEYTGLSIYTIRRNFLSDPRWPTPLVGSGARNSSRRWLASEVKKALLLFRQR